GIAIARRTYKAYRDMLASPRWTKLAAAGAQPQRLLWGSTGTKDPAAPDVLYVEALAAPDTIDTIPEKTLKAFADHGKVGQPMARVLWTRALSHNPRNPQWHNRDRFVLSAGHGSMLLYSLLHLTGYDLPLEEIERFRQWGSKAPGHPERGDTPGVEMTTGPLG